MKRFVRPRPVLALVIVALLGWSTATAQQNSATIGPASSGEDEALIRAFPNTDDETGVWFKNLSDQSGAVSVQVSDASLPAVQATIGSPFQLPFVMIDNTSLEIGSAAFPDGEKRLGIRMEYNPRIVRRRGLRMDSLHLMKFDRVREQWAPAIFSIRKFPRTGIRFFPNAPADQTLGHFGINPNENYVWATIDTNGLYGIGGVVPEPAALSLICAAGGIVVLACRPRRNVAR